MSDAAVVSPLRYRQSTLRSFTSCPRRVVLATAQTSGLVGSSAALGSAFHAVAAEILRTLYRQSETQMATEEAVAVMREVLAGGEWVLGADDYRWLKQMVLTFADYEWPISRFMAIERRLTCEILCPDGEIRALTGTPDLVMADPPGAAIVLDHKTTLGVPRSPREMPADGEAIRGMDYLSEGGYFQLVAYGTLILHTWPRTQRVVLREQNYRWGGPPREAVMSRDDLEHSLPYLGLLMQQLDTALREGEGHELAAARPGPWCATRCPVARSCPVPQEQRGLGVLDGPEAARGEAERLQVINALRDQMTKALKTYHEATGEFVEVGSGELLGWHVNGDGRRRFELRKP